MMQIKAKYHELRVFLALRPSNYIIGIVSRLFGKAVYVPRLGYLINDADLAKRILKDAEHFSINEAGGLGTLVSQLSDVPTLLSMDGEAHHKLKYDLLDLFSRESLEKHAGAEVRAIAAEIADELSSGREIDIAEFVRYSTNRLTAKLLGVEQHDKAMLLELGDVIINWMNSIDLRYQQIPDANLEEVEKYTEHLVRIARQYYNDPNVDDDCVIKRLKAMGYGFEEAKGFIIMFIVAGTVTVSSSLPRLIALLLDTGSFAKLQAEPGKLAAAIDEGLRYISPGPVVLHGVKATNVLDGHSFKHGRRVIILMYNIMHDSKYSKHAGYFDINREQNRSIQNFWFGAGVHFCMGSVLATFEIETMLQALLKLDGNLHITHRTYRRNGIYPGYKALMVRLDAKRSA